MAIISSYVEKKKIRYFSDKISKHSKILEVGCGNGWVGKYLKENGWVNYVGLDLKPPADIVGDIHNWRKLGIREQSFDTIIAFEVVEHGDFFKEFYDILKPGGLLMITSPLPCMDWFMRILELAGFNQKRTSPHTHLLYFNKAPFFKKISIKIVYGCAQWGVFGK